MADGRVTNSELQAELKAVRAEQKVEHLKTRGIVVASAFLTGGAKLASVLGFISVPFLPHS